MADLALAFDILARDKNASATNSNVTDVTSPAPAYASASSPAQGYQPAPQPVTYDTMPASNSNGSTPGSFGGGNSYTVKKGDTLYAIARAKYGDGKQWQRIAQANPGVSPSSLKVGQTITLP